MPEADMGSHNDLGSDSGPGSEGAPDAWEGHRDQQVTIAAAWDAVLASPDFAGAARLLEGDAQRGPNPSK
jgi:hypothetical protein